MTLLLYWQLKKPTASYKESHNENFVSDDCAYGFWDLLAFS